VTTKPSKAPVTVPAAFVSLSVKRRVEASTVPSRWRSVRLDV